MQEKIMLDSAEIIRLLGTVGSPLIVISELIKNSVDANATKIEVVYNKNESEIQIIDDGLGITIQEIKNLAKPGYSSKKMDGNVRNKNGFFFTGSKGLGILSCFSLCEKIVINTYTECDKSCSVVLYKNGLLEYEIDSKEKICQQGTKIILSGINIEDMEFLNSEFELQKLRHLSTYLFKKDIVSFPNISLRIDNDPPKSILFNTDLEGMLYDVIFSYCKGTGELSFACKSNKAKNINNSNVCITEFDTDALEKIALDNYGIEKTIKTRTNDTADYKSYIDLGAVPSFEGRLVVYYKQTAGAALKQYGAGVNIYVNQFAIYNYLSQDNDWLGLADFSQRKKNTNLRPHNVFGYVNFTEFNENKEKLRISNERADFIQDQIYVKLMYLLKGVVMFLIFNIDVAERNPNYKAIKKDDLETSEKQNTKDDKDIDNFISEKPPCVEDSNNKKVADKTSPNEDDDAKQKETNRDGNEQKEKTKKSEKNSDTYMPEDNYKPKKRFVSGLSFTDADGLFLEQLKNKDNLSNKIYHLSYEITHLNMTSFYCSISGVYRALLECATRYMARKHSDKITFNDSLSLLQNITNVLNYYGNDKTLNKQVKEWREAVTKRHLIDILNQYMHNEDEVDLDFIEQTWRTMRSYIIKCIS